MVVERWKKEDRKEEGRGRIIKRRKKEKGEGNKEGNERGGRERGRKGKRKLLYWQDKVKILEVF